MFRNSSTILGRLVSDPTLRKTASDIAVVSFTVAVDNARGKNSQEKTTSFIDCVAWRTTAENIAKFFKKGNKIGVIGAIQTRMYEKDGKKTKITEVVVDDFDFIESKNNAASSSNPSNSSDDISENTDDDSLPY